MSAVESIEQILTKWYGGRVPEFQKMEVVFADEVKVSLRLLEKSSSKPVSITALLLKGEWSIEQQH